MFFAKLFFVALFAALVAAAPSKKLTGCNVKSAKPSLPSGLTVPPGESVAYLALGVGVQNYTCGATGTYASAGAVAELLDISCAYGTPIFDDLAENAYKIFNKTKKVSTQDIIKGLGNSFFVLGQHYFITNPFTGTGILPKFDFTSASKKGDPNAFVVANKTGDVPAPTGDKDIHWLELTGVSGDLAKHVLRIDTVYGQPPATCAVGSPLISVKYTTQYWLYK